MASADAVTTTEVSVGVPTVRVADQVGALTAIAVEEGVVVLEIAPGVHVRFADAAVVRLLDEPTDAAA